MLADRRQRFDLSRQLVPRPAVELSTGLFLVDAAPLLEKEGNLGGVALFSDVRDPAFLNRPSSRPGLATDDNPVDIAQVKSRQRSKQRFKRQEADVRAHAAQIIDPKTIVLAFHTNAIQTFGGHSISCDNRASRPDRFVRI